MNWFLGILALVIIGFLLEAEDCDELRLASMNAKQRELSYKFLNGGMI
jgi:hypothetical protein